MRSAWWGAFLLFVLLASEAVHAYTFQLPVETWASTTSGGVTIPQDFGPQLNQSLRWGLQYGLNLTGRTDIDFDLFLWDNQFLTSKGVEFMVYLNRFGRTLTVGNPLSDILSVTGQAGEVYNIAQLSGTANTAVLSDKVKYPYVSRNYAPSSLMAGGTAAVIEYHYETYGRGWDSVAILSSSENYGTTLANALITALAETPITIATYQQYVFSLGDVSVEMREIQRSGARVIVVYSFSDNFDIVMEEADNLGLVGDDYVWFVGPTLSGSASTYQYNNGTPDLDTISRMRGQLGTQAYISRTGAPYEDLYARWTSVERTETGMGPGTVPGVFLVLVYDMGIATALSVVDAYERNLLNDTLSPSAEEWTSIIRRQEFDGATGTVRFDEKGDRPMPIGLVNFRPETRSWVTVGVWVNETGVEIFPDTPVLWYDNTTNVPDLDIRDPFSYWSCDDKEKQTDLTGKTVTLHRPDGGVFDDIDGDYHCDHYIDCANMSDESVDCDANFVAVFIAFGVITGILIILTCLLIPFVIVFGYIIRRRRIRASSPPFLIIICLSCIMGFASTYAWYGKPHPVACGFQPWLLGLAVVSLISALSAKTWRLWRLFRLNAKRGAVISDLHLGVLYLLMVAPAVIILIVWTIVSTPDARMQHEDGQDHYVCTTGGFTGKPGGLIFFFILVGYESLVLVFAGFLSIVTRNVPSFFNESKLIAISIYNLGFLAAVVIPVFLVLLEYNPFAAWIIRTIAILYAFAATLVLQFVPKVVGLLVIDRGQDVLISRMSLGKTDRLRNSPGYTTGSSSESDINTRSSGALS